MIYPEYESPIQMIMGDMEMQIEEHCVRAVQRAGFNVDAESLRQALENDSDRYREAYRKGFASGYEKRNSEIVLCGNCETRVGTGCPFYMAMIETNDSFFCGDGKPKGSEEE